MPPPEAAPIPAKTLTLTLTLAPIGGCTHTGKDSPTWAEVAPHSAPTLDGGGGPAWLAAVVTVPWELYQRHNDTVPLQKSLPAQLVYVEWLRRHVKDGLLRPFGGFWGFLGDWLTPHSVGQSGGQSGTSELSNTTQALLFNNCFYLYMLRTVAQASRLLGRFATSVSLETQADTLASAIHARFFNATTGWYLDGRQAHYVLPLWSGAVPAELRPRLLAGLADEVATGRVSGRPGHLDTGQFGTWLLAKTLTRMGRADLLVDICSQKTYPGYGFFIAKGFQTWPEAWNAVEFPTKPGAFLPSQMHGCYNGIGGWFQALLGGIQPLPHAPGSQEVLLRPAVGVRNLTAASAEVNAGFGTVAVAWQLNTTNQCVELSITVPPNTWSLLQIEASGGVIHERGVEVAAQPEPAGIQRSDPAGADADQVELTLDAGAYRFGYRLPGRGVGGGDNPCRS